MPADSPSPLTVPPVTVIALWNRVAEDSGTLEATLLRFAQLLLADASRPASTLPAAGVPLSETGCSPRRQ